MQPVKDNLGRSDVAFARNGFTEGAQNGQRVGVRSPVGAPDNWAVRDVLTKERVQMGPILLMFGLDPRRGRIVDDFVYVLERQSGEEIRDYDTRFNILLRRFEAVAGQVNPLIKAHVILRKANVSAEKQSQIRECCHESIRVRATEGSTSSSRNFHMRDVVIRFM